MTFQEQLRQLIDKIEGLKEDINTEEATKTAFVLPFIQTLGYDVFNPKEVIPEFVADISTKKNEKVDYCIQKDNEPIIIIECKHWKENLDLHNTQLERYFSFTKAKFAILTNGIKYKFYTDIDEPNKMDSKPFLEIDLENLKENDLIELSKFQKEKFDKEKIFSIAGELKYYNEIKQIYQDELQNPSDEFVKHFAYKVYSGRITEKVLNQFRKILKKALNDKINEIINERLTAIMIKENEENEEEERPKDDGIVYKDEEKGIITTKEEIYGYEIVLDILKDLVSANRIFYRDTKSYFNILLDDNNRKPICRLHFNSSQKYLGIINNDKTEEKIPIEKVEHIYMYADKIRKSLLNYLQSEKE